MLIWTLTVDSPDTGTIITCVKSSEADCIDGLREQWFEDDEDAPTQNADLVEYAVGIGYAIYIDEHDLNQTRQAAPPRWNGTMDPNTALENIHTLCAALDGDDDEVNALVDNITALDAWLSSGGFLPSPWASRLTSYSTKEH